MDATKLLSLTVGLFAITSADIFDEVEKYEISPPYFATTVKTRDYILPILKWSNGLLEPFIDRATVDAHYYGHHNTYRLKLNDVLKQWRENEPDSEFAKDSIFNVLSNLEKVPTKYQTGIINNGGGYVNHAFYWACLSPNLEANATAREPSGELLDEINKEFGSFAEFKEEFTTKALTLFGSGYVWLLRRPNSSNRQLFITTTTNQDSPISNGDQPLLVIDVWEHAYYLKHQYKRVNYISDWWMVVDWDNVQELNQFWKDGMKLADKYSKPIPQTKREEEKEEL